MSHRNDCPDPTTLRTFRGRLGDLMLTCLSCARSWPAPADTPEPTHETRTIRIPPCPPTTRTGWPTHKARARNNRRHRAYKERTKKGSTR